MRRIILPSLLSLLFLAASCGPSPALRHELDAFPTVAGTEEWSLLEARAEEFLRGRLTPDMEAEALYWRGLARGRLDRWTEGLADLARCRSLAPGEELEGLASLEEARIRIRLGEFRQALQLLAPLGRSSPGVLRVESILLQTEILIAQDRLEEAQDLLRRRSSGAGSATGRNRLELRLARIELETELEAGLTRLAGLARAEGLEESWPAIHLELAERAEAQGEHRRAARQYALAVQASGSPAPDPLLEGLRRNLALSGPDGELQELLRQEDMPLEVRWEIARHRIQRLTRSAAFPEALKLIQEMEPILLDSPWAESLGELRDRVLVAAEVDPYRIGLLLPFQGRLAPYSLQVLRGATVALERFQTDHPEMEVRFVKSDLSTLAPEEALTRLVEEEQVGSAIGPLLSDRARDLAPHLDLLELPLLTPGAPAVGVPALSPFLFRCSLTPESEVRALLDRAVYNLGLSSFAVLHPDNPAGQELQDAFLAEAQALGVSVVASLEYPQGIADFSEQMRRLRGETFDGLFVADGPREAGLIAPQLLFHDMKEVLLLGTSALNDPELVEVGGPYVEDAVFTEAFHPGPGQEEYNRFHRKYQEQFGEPPDRLACQGYECATAILATLSAGARTREEIRQGLSGPAPLPGLMGVLLPTDEGELERVIHLMTVSRRRIIQLDWEYLPIHQELRRVEQNPEPEPTPEAQVTPLPEDFYEDQSEL